MKRFILIMHLISCFGFINLSGQDGLVGYWNFDSLAGNQFEDLSGHENHGSVFGAELVPGIRGNALGFDGQGDYAKIGGSDTIPHLLQELGEGTISLWFRVEYIPRLHGIAPLFYYGGMAQCDFFDAANQGLILEVGHSPIHFESERLYFTIWKNGCTYPSFCFDSRDPIKKEQWHHYAVVVGKDFNTGYLNGQEMDNRRYNFGNDSYSQFFADALKHEVLWLGKGHWDRTEQFLNGAIDELRIYDHALGVEEIEALYQENDGSVGLTHSIPEKKGMVLYPNPTTGKVHYNILESGLEIKDFVIIGPAGNIISSVHTVDKTGMIPLEGLPPGMYTLGFKTASQIIHHKFIIH